MTQTLDELVGSDIIDTRDILTRYEDMKADFDEDETENCGNCGILLGEDERTFCTEHQEEYDELEEITNEFPSEWYDGETLVSEDYFEEYARELADDIGSCDLDQWPFYYIDWERAAEALKQDYTTVEIRGITYYGRA